MPVKTNEEMKKEKRELILESARSVFCRKGYIAVTMKDIIEECNISRGGIYIYFSSVAEIFKVVVTQRNKSKFESIREQAQGDIDFYSLLNSYFATQKTRLLHMEASLLRAMYEYLFTHNEASDNSFRDEQLHRIQLTISEILILGVRQSYLHPKMVKVISQNIMFVIEGLSTFVLMGGITEEYIDGQFTYIQSTLRATGGKNFESKE